MNESMLALGTFRFSVNTAAFDELVRISEWRWQEKVIVGELPKLDYTGPALESIEIKGTILPHYKGGLGQLDEMRKIAGIGAPQRLVTGTGKDLGSWVITKLHETQRQFYRKGTPLKQEFTLTLREYDG